MHSTENAHILETPAIQHHLNSGKISTSLIPQNAIKLTSKERDLSALLTSKTMWDPFPDVENILFFQLDSIICSNSNRTVDDFLHYDWIGAPWPWLPQIRGGNGGFSLRRKSRMLRCLQTRTWTGEGGIYDWSEDMWYNRCMMSFPDAVLPTYQQQKEFSVESDPSPIYFGLHRPKHGPKPYMDFCPEIAMIYM